MAETRLAVREPDGTVRFVRARSRQIAGEERIEEYVAVGAAETWVAYVDAVAFAANKHHVTIFNAAGSAVVVKLRKLFPVNLQTAAVTGIVPRFDIRRIGVAPTAGTTITPVAHDTDNVALPVGVTVRTNGTVNETGAVTFFPWLTSSEEETAVPGLSKSMFQQATNVLLEGAEIQELTLREGFGVTVKQVTSSAVGSFGWILAFTVE